MAKKKENQPVHEIRLGRVKATIWANDTSAGIRHNVTFSRLYKDGDNWEQSASFGRDDLPLIMKVADQAHDWVYANSVETKASEKEAA